MKKIGQTVFRTSFPLALAAAIAISSAGCSGSGAHTSSAPSESGQASTESSVVSIPTEPFTDIDINGGKPDVPDSSAAAGTTKPEQKTEDSAAASGTSSETAADSAATSAAASETAAPSEVAAADETSAAAETAETTDTDSSTADAAAAATSSTSETAAIVSDNGESAAADALDDGIPKRDTKDTALKESVLSEALVACTGWGQSAGSSLRAASASVMLLQWANETEAGNVDTALLSDTVKAEVNRLSDAQKENLKANWSSVSYDASMILDDFEEMRPILEDAGCAEAAKAASENPKAVKNWEALEHALDAVLK